MYYYYDKDHYGKENCYELEDDELLQEKENALDGLVNDAIPVWYIRDWASLDWDPEHPNDCFMVKAITDYLGTGAVLPAYLITHWHDKLDEKYEVVPTKDDIDYDELINEYANSHAYKIDPVFYKEGEITAEEAEKLGMYALAVLINQKKKEEDDPMTPEEKLLDILKGYDLYDLKNKNVSEENCYELYKDIEADVLKYFDETDDHEILNKLDAIVSPDTLGKYLESRLNNGTIKIEDLKNLFDNITDKTEYFWLNRNNQFQPLNGVRLCVLITTLKARLEVLTMEEI